MVTRAALQQALLDRLGGATLHLGDAIESVEQSAWAMPLMPWSPI